MFNFYFWRTKTTISADCMISMHNLHYHCSKYPYDDAYNTLRVGPGKKKKSIRRCSFHALDSYKYSSN